MNNQYGKDAKVFKAFDDEKRLKILEMLRGGEKCACILLEKMDISQSTLSHHMKILCESGIVSGRKEGKWTYYSINEEGSIYAVKLLEKLTKVNDNMEVNKDEEKSSIYMCT
ncbi:metalloregulator ArsR/SmtB family transcription factor [Clostridium sp. SM-530-WT-3G]|uniref:ArsR/SmtB family transcription factor n=1 Tax=Clostridium sp. SM-530-WT-3G TaxID=2725303 RepID=UPI00145EEE30|nr:metalloregulator ArsR/SmtB family transcription factor [Clostridium sp. SM-530-WT-3G]NME83606.1 winged helix-turn-helix transcriptional regulator [Clostridium sp. SM-530-WT-3G]